MDEPDINYFKLDHTGRIVPIEVAGLPVLLFTRCGTWFGFEWRCELPAGLSAFGIGATFEAAARSLAQTLREQADSLDMQADLLAGRDEPGGTT